ncbi:MAG: N-acetylornithine carbamoyltransferase [Phycisphaerales bacterium]|nr:N-acetylornithine carbamoyltransferase [Phycisphaerales bacterium]
MREWLSMFEERPSAMHQLITLARQIKAGQARDATAALRGRILGMVFFNPSLRTRVSFESAMARFGGHAICLNVGGDAWGLEHRDGVVMNADKAEHVREAAPVLSRYCDVLGVRTFAQLRDASEDARDGLIRAFAAHATVPVINLESAMEHPCQALADWMTMEEKLGETAGRHFTLSWAPQAKAVPMAVPHSAALAAAAAGMHVTIAHPPIYELNAGVMDRIKTLCDLQGTRFTISSDQGAACSHADVLYVKSWGSTAFYGDAAAQQASFAEHADWMVQPRHLHGRRTILMHCLPVRRNVVISDEALDDPRCVVVDQAENRLWTQAAVLAKLLAPS